MAIDIPIGKVWEGDLEFQEETETELIDTEVVLGADGEVRGVVRARRKKPEFSPPVCEIDCETMVPVDSDCMINVNNPPDPCFLKIPEGVFRGSVTGEKNLKALFIRRFGNTGAVDAEILDGRGQVAASKRIYVYQEG